MAAHPLNQPRRPTPTLNFNSPGSQRSKKIDLGFPIHRHIEPDHGEPDFKEIMGCTGNITINGKVYKTDIQDLEPVGVLGNGTCGHVVKMLHKPSGQHVAVKQMRRSKDENSRIRMDLEVVLKSNDCEYIVQYLGCFVTEAEVWICMELMQTCMDKLLKNIKKPIPENVIGKVAVATVKALDYLKDKHNVIHRDVKPSNILLDSQGNVKLCDFGISGRLVDSKAITRSAGCTAYMAPERIEPPDPIKPNYDIRADVWSLGITLVELAIGKFPYENCQTDFEVLSRIVKDEPPSLPLTQNYSQEFRSFVNLCLKKNYKERPKYKQLLQHEFIKIHEAKSNKTIEMKFWFDVVCAPVKKSAPSSIGRASGSSRIMRPSPSVGSSGSSISSATTSPSPNSIGGGRYEYFRPPERARSTIDRLHSEPGFYPRSPSTPGTPSPNTGLPPDPPPRRSRLGSGSDGLRTPSLTTSSSSSSGGNASSPMGISSMSNGGSPSPPDPPPPPMRRLRMLLLCYSGSC